MTVRTRRAMFPAVIALLCVGCHGWPSARRLDECRNRTRALQAEMAQLKDETLRLRDRNRELARRAIEDSERIQALAAAGGQTQQAAMSFQREREELARAYAELQQQVQAAADIPVRAGRDADQRRR